MKDEVINVEKFKVKYPILKKEGYKLSYGEKTKDYVDVFLIKKIDDVISVTIHITERKVVKRYEGSDYKVEGMTVREVLGVAEILKELKLTSTDNVVK